MENDINNTLAFDLALQFVPTRTGPVEDAVAQAMERSILCLGERKNDSSRAIGWHGSMGI